MDRPEIFLERDPAGRSEQLFIVLHGYGASPDEMLGVRQAIRAAYPHADIFTPKLPFAGVLGWFCVRSMEALLSEWMAAIRRLWDARAKAGGRYQRIVLVGHSFGSVAARKIAILAHGETPEAPFEGELQRFRFKQPWADALDRIVSLAGMHGGWSVSSTLDWITTVWWSIGGFIGDVIFQGRPTIFAIRKGAPYLVQTRLQWLALMRRKQPPPIVVIQLLGTVDDIVAPDDTIDYAVDFHSQETFFLLEVPETGHFEAILMAPPANDADHSAPAERWKAFSLAIEGAPDAIAAKAIPREHMADTLPPAPDESVTDVVFVIHGIRDKGFWTQKIARAIKREAGAATECQFRSVTTSYGYFAMAPFVFPWVRRQKVAWLMDRYTEARARYPAARFSYVGHSNGTYLLARALQDYPAASFKNVVFAGSVVRCDYDWASLLQASPTMPDALPRVERILNYVATGDIVVALFPKALQPIRQFDLGSAGHDGFRQATLAGPVQQVEYVIGRHGAGVRESQWDDIARFVVRGICPPESDKDRRDEQSWLVRQIGHWATPLLAAAVAVVVGFGVLLLWSVFQQQPCIQGICVPFYSMEPTLKEMVVRAFAFMAFVSGVYVFVTRF